MAQKADAFIYIPFCIGDPISDGVAIAIVKRKTITIAESMIMEPIELQIEPGFNNDPKYAIRLLVDAAIRALSPALNDPTTAVQVLDRIEYLLYRLGNSNLDIGIERDARGMVRFLYNTPSWENYLQLAFCEIICYGATSIQVLRRVNAVLLFLRQNLPEDRIQAVQKYSNLCQSITTNAFQNTTFQEWANIPDREGIGSSS